MGNDGHNGIDPDDDFRRPVPLEPGWPRADGSGLEARFSVKALTARDVDEDDGVDELYVKITYWDCFAQRVFTYQTDDEVGELRG
jgi:hypothetical protein